MIDTCFITRRHNEIPTVLITGVTAARTEDRVFMKLIGVVVLIIFIYSSLVFVVSQLKDTLPPFSVQDISHGIADQVGYPLGSRPFLCLLFG